MATKRCSNYLCALLLAQAQLDPVELGPFRACLSLPDDEAGIEWCRRAAVEPGGTGRASVALLVLGVRLAALERWEGVVDAYRRRVALAPEDPGADRRLGEALMNGVGAPAEALASFEEAARLDPADARAHGFRGIALNALGRNPEGLRAFEDALLAEPSFFTLRPAAAPHSRCPSPAGSCSSEPGSRSS